MSVSVPRPYSIYVPEDQQGSITASSPSYQPYVTPTAHLPPPIPTKPRLPPIQPSSHLTTPSHVISPSQVSIISPSQGSIISPARPLISSTSPTSPSMLPTSHTPPHKSWIHRHGYKLLAMIILIITIIVVVAVTVTMMNKSNATTTTTTSTTINDSNQQQPASANNTVITTQSPTTNKPTQGSTQGPTQGVTPGPTQGATPGPTQAATPGPTQVPTQGPTQAPTQTATPTTRAPTAAPTQAATQAPTQTAIPTTRTPTTSTPTASPVPTTSAPTLEPAGSNGIAYLYNGPVMTQPVTVHLVFYGTWTLSSPAVTILPTFINEVGNSTYWSTVTTYYQVNPSTQVRTPVTSNIKMGKLVIVPAYAPYNYNLTDNNVYSILFAQANGGNLGTFPDSNAIYFLVTSSNVTQTGFCVEDCAWHGYGGALKYGWVGDASYFCPSKCQAGYRPPNGDRGADYMVAMLAHELTETVTDPYFSTWVNPNNDEVADKCAWHFGTVYSTTNGAQANVHMGTHDYLVQQNWVNEAGGYCGLCKRGLC